MSCSRSDRVASAGRHGPLGASLCSPSPSFGVASPPARLAMLACCAVAIGSNGAIAQPANDDCASAVQVFRDITFAGTTVDATSGGIANSSCSNGDTLDTWHRFTPAESGPLLFSLCGSAYDTTISLWDGCGGMELACADLSCGLQSEVTYSVTAGQDIYVRVSGWNGGSGQYVLNITDGPVLPNPGDFSEGPDVVLSDTNSVTNWGAVGGVRGYSIQSDTCNYGDQGLEWGFSVQETPVLAMNAYRYADGMLMQIGQGWCKTACCAAQGNGCGLGCTTVGGMLGPGCLDVYGSSYNGGQSRLAPRSSINAWSGDVTPRPAAAAAPSSNDSRSPRPTSTSPAPPTGSRASTSVETTPRPATTTTTAPTSSSTSTRAASTSPRPAP